MRRLLCLLGSDIRFQWRYGFYGVYVVLSLFYVAVVRLVPEGWRPAARALTLYSDPAALGFFFIGAIVLFEKGERVLSALSVSPVRPWEYTLSKLVSLGLISSVSSLVIQTAGGGAVSFGFVAGIFLGACLFTAIGLSIAAAVPTVNAFFVRSIPLGAAVFTLGPLTWLGLVPSWLAWNPGSLILALIAPTADARSWAFPALLAWLFPVCVLTVYRVQTLFVAEVLDDRAGGIA